MPELAQSPSSHPTVSSSSIVGPSTQLPLSTNLPKFSKSTKNNKQKPGKPTKLTKSTKPTKPTKPTNPAKETTPSPATDDVEGAESQDGEWYAIKDIVDEKLERGVRYYLIDWCNDAVTGKSYEKSWIPARDANSEAVRDWKQVKKARNIQTAGQSTLKTKPKPKPKSKSTATHAPKSSKPKSSPAKSVPVEISSQSSYANTSSVLTSQESQALTPPSGNGGSDVPEKSIGRRLQRKRPVSPSEKEIAGEDATPPPRKRRLVRGIRLDTSRAVEPSLTGNDQSQSQSRRQSQSQGQGQSVLSSPPATREQSVDHNEVSRNPERLDPDTVLRTAATVHLVDITTRPDFDPKEYIRLSQQSHLSQISRLALQRNGWLQPQSAVAFQFSSDDLPSLSPTSEQLSSVYHSSQKSNSPDEADFEEDCPQLPSGLTIPDSQAEENGTLRTAIGPDDELPLFVDQFEDSSPIPDEVPTPKVSQVSQELLQQAAKSQSPSFIPSVLSQQPAPNTDSTASGEAQVVPCPLPTPSQENQLFRSSTDWASEEPSTPVEASADKSTTSGTGSASLNFLTQPEADFCLLTQESQQPGQPIGQQIPGGTKTPLSSSAAGSNNFSAVSIIHDSTRPIRVASTVLSAARNPSQTTGSSFSSIPRPSSAQIIPPPYSNNQGRDRVFDSPTDLSNPRPSTPSQQIYRAPEAIMDESPRQPISAVDKLRQAMQAQFDSTANDDAMVDSSMTDEDDPLVLAEIHRLEEEMAAASSQQQEQQPHQQASQEESITSSSSNVLPVSVPLTTTPATRADAALDAPGTIDTSLPLLISPAAINNAPDIHSVTIAPGDLSFVDADPMATSGLELSPEPEPEYPLVGIEGSGNTVNADVDDFDGNDGDDAGDDDEAKKNEAEAPSSPLSMGGDEDDLPSLSGPNFTTSSYVVTLPFAANTRQYYADLVIEKENQKAIKDFSEVFSRDVYEVPSAEAVARIDELLRKLMDFSDLPTFYDSLPPMSKEAMMKHAVDTNSKYSFVYEFLEAISTLEKDVLILVRKGVAMDYVEAIVSTAGISVERFQAGSHTHPRPLNPGKTSTESGDSGQQERRRRRSGSLSVLLADTTEMREAINATRTNDDDFPRPGDFDIVIGFDHTARTSGLLGYFLDGSTATAENVAAQNYGKGARRQLPKPIVMLLVSALSLEHVDLRLERNSVDDMERKNALLLCTIECLSHLRDNPYDINPPKPHEAATAFAKMIADPTDVLAWGPTPLPEEVFDIYIHSSGAVSQPTFTQEETLDGGLLTSRKRQLVSDDGDDQVSDTPKRVRLTDATNPIVREVPIQFNDVIKYALGRLDVTAADSSSTVQISLAQLEALAAKVTLLESQLEDKEGLEATLTERVRTLDRLVKSNTSTIINCQKKLIESVKDRGIFEAERDKAIKEADAVKEKLEARTVSLAELRTETTALENHLSEANALLAGSSQVDVAELGAARVALKEAQDRVTILERKSSNADNDLSHARRAYQDASNAAADLSAENRNLNARIKELEHRASDNLVKIHEAQNRNESEAARQQWAEAVTMLGERERELEWAREELRVLKNSRRETRQQSVPRSPRLSVMSPRTVGRGSSVGVGANGGGSSSASATPIPNIAGAPAVGAGFVISARTSVSRGNSPVSANFDPSVYSGMLSGGNGGNGGNGGTGGGPPLPGMTYLNSNQGGGRWGHLRD
ncbi:hypothetical protein SPBR_06331 [Sporothrix brasiliensis 5110]|uniref:Chromo domain-containing protein n=1 Tax=Sporothrix brasiliensis 5110 TaxID=1398154 RepID=A0A0C2EP94_9PEZI|nr:uncharacterized protein SPBR_06331 [Sporothrix brasiliensis 5110]KIH88019.1 hypothetical protein SPBR_06331 [Sporothrix brasiliensis 5110]